MDFIGLLGTSYENGGANHFWNILGTRKISGSICVSISVESVGDLWSILHLLCNQSASVWSL